MQDKKIARDKRAEAQFVRVHYGYYERKWKGRENSVFFLSWNGAAFLFSTSWLLYRRMFLPAALCLLLSNVAAQLATTMESYIAVLIGAHLVTGLCGNSIYMNHVLDMIDKYREKPANEQEALNRLGGANLIPPLLLEAVSLIFLFM